MPANRPLALYYTMRCKQPVKAKFHYAIQLASRSKTSLRPNSIRLSSSRPAGEQVCDQLASQPRAGSRPASELGEDMRVHVVYVSQVKFHYAVQLASRSQISSRPNSITLSSLQPARELVALADLLASRIV